MIETHPFGNFIPKNINSLILGSFIARGSAKGVDYDWYYSNGRNHFWYIISQVYNQELKSKESKIKLLKELGIGIADIIYQCERKENNSLDNNLINIVFNPELSSMLEIPSLRKVLFTSRFVENLFSKKFKHLIEKHPNIQYVTLPSPSPRYATMSKDEKVKKYKNLLFY